jgi:SAM-dependent methyltransferase
MDRRQIARQLAKTALENGQPLAWFEELYRQNKERGVPIPWADLHVNPNLVEFFEKLRDMRFGKRSITVGCGFGDDAAWLAARGFDVTAFDISPTAIDECRRRFASSGVNFVAADLLGENPSWHQAFDLVEESYTLQVLPPDLRRSAITRIADFVAPGGHLLLIARANRPGAPEATMPWPLTNSELDTFKNEGLEQVYFEEYLDCETPPVPRFRACYHRP